MNTEVASSSQETKEHEHTFRATQLWQELVLSFRLSMPRCKHRLKMRWYDDSFTGREAVEWLHDYLQSSGNFGSVCKDQAVKLLQKFLSSDVITEVRDRLAHFEEDTTYLYKFVTEPGPFNFIEEAIELPRPLSPVGKRERCNSLYMDTEPTGFDDGACFSNEYAFDNEAMIVSPLKKSRSEGCLSQHLAVRDLNIQDVREKLTPAQVAATWKEVTLSRLLRLVELPSLDTVLDHNAVDGKLIQCNALTGRSLLNKAAAKFRRSIKGLQDRKPPLPPTHTLATTHHHHKRRFSTKIKSDSQIIAPPPHDECVTDVPQWLVLAMKCLTKWPDGCTEELVGGRPVYAGFELDVLQSVVEYFHGLTEPLISTKLFDLLMAVNNLVTGDKAGVTDALQLCALLLPQTNRTCLHRMLRFLYKASSNSQLVLCQGKGNKEVLLKHFASAVLRSCSKLSRVGLAERQRVEQLVAFMAQNYQHIFKVPGDLKKDVQKRLDAISTGKGDCVPSVAGACCSRLSTQEYESEGASASQNALLGLLDTIIADQGMSSKDKRHRLKDFQKAYPELYAQRLPPSPQEVKGYNRSGRKVQRHTSLSVRGRPRPLILREKYDSSETLNAVNLR